MNLLTLLALTPALARMPGEVQDAWAVESAESKRESARDLGLLLHEDPSKLHLELLIAEATDARAASRWGHALLRFVDGDGDPFDDLVLAFGAELDSPRVSLWRGIVGGYEAVPMVRRLGWIYLDYVQEQGRALDRVPLPSDPGMVAALLNGLAQRAELGLGPYTFFQANCAGLLVDALEEAGFPETTGRIPVRLGEAYAKQGAAPLPPVRVGLPVGLIAEAAALAQIPEGQLRSGDWPAGTAQKLAPLSDIDRQRLLYALSPPTAERGALLASLPPPQQRPPLTEILGFDAYSEHLYVLCTEVSCAREVRAAAEARFGATALNERLALAPAGDANPFQRHVRLLQDAANP